MKIVIFLLTFIIFYLGFGVFLSNLNFENTTTQNSFFFHDYSGVLNVHSNKSSGSGTVQEIITAANDAELDFIIFNNENPINQKEPAPITFGQLNVFYGHELNYKDSRFLTLSHQQSPVFDSHSAIKIYMSNLLDSENEELIVLAHPDKENHEWKESIPTSLSGMEVINLREIWNKSWKESKGIFLLSLIFYPFNPQLFFLKIFSPSFTSETKWNNWSNDFPLYGFLGSDATSKLRVLSKSFIRFPGYKTLFSLAKNHILLEEELTGTKNHYKILQAFKRGHFYFSLDVLGNPQGFSLYTKENETPQLLTSELLGRKQIHISLPTTQHKTRIVVLKNGEVFKILKKERTFWTDPGVYRIRVELQPRFPLIRSVKWIPWIYSNIFEIKIRE